MMIHQHGMKSQTNHNSEKQTWISQNGHDPDSSATTGRALPPVRVAVMPGLPSKSPSRFASMPFVFALCPGTHQALLSPPARVHGPIPVAAPWLPLALPLHHLSCCGLSAKPPA